MKNAALLFLLCAITAHADVTLPKLFSEHMVLQQTEKAPIWGKAEAGEKVKVTIGEATAEATAGSDGKWKTVLNLKTAGEGPYTMVVEGKNRIEIGDVLIGQVWLCSGQSNMEFTLNRSIGSEEAIAKAANPKLRYFGVPRATPEEPSETVNGSWVVASPETVPKFSAVAYHFGRTLQEKLGQPVGLIQSSVGGTPSEAWTSLDALASDADLKEGTEKMNSAYRDYPAKKKAYVEALPAWEKANQREDHPPANVEIYALMQDKAGWKKISLPGKFVDAGLPDAGAVWLVKKFSFKESDAKKEIRFVLGTPNGFDTVYWNGRKVGGRTLANMRGADEIRTYNIPGKDILNGENILAVRLFSSEGGLEILKKFSHPGDWMAKTEFEFPSTPPNAGRDCPIAPSPQPDIKGMPYRLFNGMIAPLIPYAIKGAIWYQGENNASRAFQYRKALPLMISDWRQRWDEGDFPFYICQLANYHAKTDKPGDNMWAELREAQTFAAQNTPNCGQAILIDIGEAADIHPRNKADVGKRLAALALADTYGVKGPFTGPVYDSMSVEGNKIRIRFKPNEAKLTATALPAEFPMATVSNEFRPLVRNSPNSQLEGFSICGKDMQWTWAEAKIDGDTVIVESEKVPEPIAVRYAWAQNPTCNLSNTAGFPAGPFRTDNFPSVTQNARF